MLIAGIGAIFFGLLVGWVAYWILRRRAGAFMLAELITIVGVLGGAVVIALFKDEVLFGWYAIGLILGFFAYFAVGLLLYGKQEVQPWRIEQSPQPPPASPSSPPATDGSNVT